jgi:hypothetical protein
MHSTAALVSGVQLVHIVNQKPIGDAGNHVSTCVCVRHLPCGMLLFFTASWGPVLAHQPACCSCCDMLHASSAAGS